MASPRVAFHPDKAKKVILLGNASVGKTSLAARWIYGCFDEAVVPTIGASNSFKEVEIGQRLVRIALWDTAGQEKFRAITPLYIRGACVAIIVAAADSLESFHAIPNWLDLLANTQEDQIPALLAVNKSDLQDPWLHDAMAKLIELYRGSFVTVFCVSAMTGDQVSELFEEAARITEYKPGQGTRTLLPVPSVSHRGRGDCC
jgi:small GTP-binding protein